ncbi:uncharacterized protein LOC119657441 isoform X2 [Hermetia illucens]|uniref:uncharacterized protein LOC119657441 isoform X2 n=1 Tax=Hermetia illucens TaxID=343691 RepID=UPI0018CC42CA|nr:uncharacterized protein LOC119657441 isoform X2 [Hermetia illucens]
MTSIINYKKRYFANQKGSKRFPPCDTETIKKFTAVQCLLDAVSTEQEISRIENLVDELFEKLIDLEKQSNEEDSPVHHQLPASIKSLDIEDPRKRYYRAFPALSKEMEDSVWRSKSNDKSLTWPTGNSGTSSANMVALNNTAGVKRKNKRRRNQSMNKTRAASARKNSYGGNSSPTWDTDFEGNWEMGTDLIKEFLMSQKNRNRSISESDATSFRYEKNSEKRMKPATNECIKSAKISNLNGKPIKNSVADNLNKSSNLSCSSRRSSELVNKSGMPGNIIATKDANEAVVENEDVMHAYLPYEELISFKEFDNFSKMARRLYQDEAAFNIEKPSVKALQQQQNDFAKFEAKFNSDVEALWKDNKNNENSEMASAARDVKSQRNIDNFWTNYYNHHYNKNNIGDKSIRSFVDKSKAETSGVFYSLPHNFGKLANDNDRSIEKVQDDDLPSVGVFLNDSIWSDNRKDYNEDDSFYGNCWAPKSSEKGDVCDGKDFPNPFNISKWSECSFETPFIPSNTSTSTEAVTGKSLYGSTYKHPIVAATNKAIGSNTMFQQQQHHHSQSQLSQPISLPDYYGSSLSCFEKNRSLSPTNVSVMVSQHQQALSTSTTSTTTTRTVSLTNHSKTSGFIEYSIVKSSSSFFQLNSIGIFDRTTNANQPRNTMPQASAGSQPAAGFGEGAAASLNDSSASSTPPLDDDENLLTSYRTHFRPIKQNYADGYQFDISGNLDEVEFERSKSGGLYLESERYFEYTRFDTFLSDEDSTSSSSICSFGDENRLKDVEEAIRPRGLYPLKFRMKQVDKQCQTDDLDQAAETGNQADLILIAKKRNINHHDKVDCADCAVDEADYSTDSDGYFNEETSIDLDQWSMAEIGKKCADNNNSHTLWGMCPACTKENKCVPANRLLKDELIVEADEIMSDLKYMQDLYICSDWENEDDDETDSELEALKNDDDDESGGFGNENSLDDDEDDYDNKEQEQIFYNITKLISDLLKPENAKSLVNVLSASAANQNKNIFKGMCSEDELADNGNASLFDYQKNVIWKNVNNNNEKYIGGLWSNDENIIWKREMKSWNNWPRLNDNKTTAFLEKLNWKHANLAAIWKGSSTTGADENEIKSCSPSSDKCEGKHPVEPVSGTIMTSFSEKLNWKHANLAALWSNESTAEQTEKESKSSSSSSNGKFQKNDTITASPKDPQEQSDEHIESNMAMLMNMNNRNLRNPISWNISSSKRYTDSTDLVPHRKNSHQIIDQSANSETASQAIVNRPDRKRRHSASQNMSCNGSCTSDIGNMTLEWCGGINRQMSAKIGDCNKVEIKTKWKADSNKLSDMMHADDSLSSSSLSPETTIITCKYWTTMDTTLASPYILDKSSHYDGIGAMALNPSSILRHVAVVSRPLTR